MRSTNHRAAWRRDFVDEDEPLSGWARRLLPRSPRDGVALGVAAAAALAIIINALFMQAGRHPAPFFAETSQRSAIATGSVPLPPPAKRQANNRSPAATLPAGLPNPGQRKENRSDPIAELLEPPNRTVAVQRALAEFGYGQIKPTGVADPETRAAIEKFERDRKLPVTGQISERLTRELTAMKGGPL